MPDSLLILGASVRAAASSAVRAGFAPWCADLFADLDLRRFAPAVRVSDYPTGLIAAASEAPPGPWLYTGGLENHPDLVAAIAARRPLLGNPPELLRAVRDPFRLHRAMTDAGVPSPAPHPAPAELPTDGSWLLKPLGGCGGSGITAWRGDRSTPAVGCYLQPRIEGTAHSAVYVAAAGQAVLLGVTQQRLATRPGADGPWQYAGSIGPAALPPGLHDQAARIGSAAAAFGLVGLFGVDMILSGGKFHPVEVNPRYTASVEILERATGIRSIALHAAACRDGELPPEPPARPTACHGKAILYAPRDVEITESFSRQALAGAAPPWPEVADIPSPGQTILAGHPVMTLFAQGADPASVEALLSREAMRWRDTL